MRLNISESQFDRTAWATFSAILGMVAGAVCLLADAGPWLSMVIAVVWTAVVGKAED